MTTWRGVRNELEGAWRSVQYDLARVRSRRTNGDETDGADLPGAGPAAAPAGRDAAGSPWSAWPARSAPTSPSSTASARCCDRPTAHGGDTGLRGGRRRGHGPAPGGAGAGRTGPCGSPGRVARSPSPAARPRPVAPVRGYARRGPGRRRTAPARRCRGGGPVPEESTTPGASDPPPPTGRPDPDTADPTPSATPTATAEPVTRRRARRRARPTDATDEGRRRHRHHRHDQGRKPLNAGLPVTLPARLCRTAWTAT